MAKVLDKIIKAQSVTPDAAYIQGEVWRKGLVAWLKRLIRR